MKLFKLKFFLSINVAIVFGMIGATMIQVGLSELYGYTLAIIGSSLTIYNIITFLDMWTFKNE